MSDQTDIELSTLRNDYRTLWYQNEASKTREIELRAQITLRDEETARLKRENAELTDGIERATEDIAELRARLADAEKNYADVVDSNQHWHVRVEQLNAERDRYLERAEEAETRLAETQESYLPKVQQITSLTARQLALESQCQRMRDALRILYNRGETALAIEVLSDPLDLELLNFLKQKLINARVMLTGEPRMPTHAADLIDEALKSLSPAP